MLTRFARWIWNSRSWAAVLSTVRPTTRHISRRSACIETLEVRVLPTITYSVTFDDPGATHTAFYNDLEQNLLATGDHLNQYLAGTASIEVVIGFSESLPTATGGSETVTVVRVEDGITIVQSGATSEIRTGTDPNGAEPDIRITFGIDYLTNEVWLDPTPFSDSDPVPDDKVDGYSVLLHEIVHALGFIGYGSSTDGSITGGFATLYDDWVTFVDGDLYFNGPEAISVYGSPVPLTFGNHFHVGNAAPRPGSELLTDLMNGVIGYRGLRDVVSPLDLAILSDTLVPLLVDVGPNTPPEIAPQSFLIAEQSPDGTLVGTVLATDADVGQSRVFAILSGDPNGIFSIDPATGSITVTNGSLLVIESQVIHVLVIQVTDNGMPALSDTADITINLSEQSVPQVVTSPGTTIAGKGSTIAIDASADLESGSNFTSPDGTRLTVTITSGARAKDRLQFTATGDKTERLKLKKGILKRGKTSIATVSTSGAGTALDIRFSAGATTTDVERTLKNAALKFSRKNTGLRMIAFQFFLIDGSTGLPDSKEVVIP